VRFGVVPSGWPRFGMAEFGMDFYEKFPLVGSGKPLSGKAGRAEALFGVECSGVVRMGTVRWDEVGLVPVWACYGILWRCLVRQGVSWKATAW